MNIFELERQLGIETHRFHPTFSRYVVYFLLQENEIVYVGKSDTRNYLGRIRKHIKSKTFDSYHVLPLDMNERDSLAFESSLISTLQPIYNVKDSYTDLNKITSGLIAFRGSQEFAIQGATKSRSTKIDWLIFILFIMLFPCVTGLSVVGGIYYSTSMEEYFFYGNTSQLPYALFVGFLCASMMLSLIRLIKFFPILAPWRRPK